MNLISVRCHHCGAPLEISDAARFVTCKFCQSELAVQRTDSAVFTELMGKIERKTEQMAGSLEVIQLQNDIEKLDREWEMQRQGLMIRNQQGVMEPPGAGNVVGGIFGIIIGIVWFIATSSAMPSQLGGISVLFPCFGLLVSVMSGIGMVSSQTKASAYESAQTRYESRRRALEAQLDQARWSGSR